MKNESYEITTPRLFLIIVSAVVSTAIATAFALLRVANSDHFTIVALGDRLSSVEQMVVFKPEYEERAKHIDNSLLRIEQKVDRLLEKGN